MTSNLILPSSPRPTTSPGRIRTVVGASLAVLLAAIVGCGCDSSVDGAEPAVQAPDAFAEDVSSGDGDTTSSPELVGEVVDEVGARDSDAPSDAAVNDSEDGAVDCASLSCAFGCKADVGCLDVGVGIALTQLDPGPHGAAVSTPNRLGELLETVANMMNWSPKDMLASGTEEAGLSFLAELRGPGLSGGNEATGGRLLSGLEVSPGQYAVDLQAMEDGTSEFKSVEIQPGQGLVAQGASPAFDLGLLSLVMGALRLDGAGLTGTLTSSPQGIAVADARLTGSVASADLIDALNAATEAVCGCAPVDGPLLTAAPEGSGAAPTCGAPTATPTCSGWLKWCAKITKQCSAVAAAQLVPDVDRDGDGVKDGYSLTFTATGLPVELVGTF